MLNRRTTTLAALVFCGAVCAPTPAAAEPQMNEGCPPPFFGLTKAEQLALAAKLGVPKSEVLAAIAKIDKNGDKLLCFMILPSGHANIVDNRSAHRG